MQTLQTEKELETLAEQTFLVPSLFVAAVNEDFLKME